MRRHTTHHPACACTWPRFLLVGEAPNLAVESRPELWLCPDRSGIRHSANRLLEYSHLGHQAFHSCFDRTNLLHRAQPRVGCGRAFPLKEARAAADSLVVSAIEKGYLGIVVLGRRAATAFMWIAGTPAPGPDYLKWGLASGMPVDSTRLLPLSIAVVVVPHPSGINQWWNSERNRKLAARFFQRINERCLAELSK